MDTAIITGITMIMPIDRFEILLLATEVTELKASGKSHGRFTG